MKTLEQYLRESYEAGAIDHAIRCEVREGGQVKFYIHPEGADGDTLDFVVTGNALGPDPLVTTGT